MLPLLRTITEALALERDAHAERFRTLTTSAPVRQRVSEGIAWYPLRIVERGFGFGEYPYVVVERTSSDHSHQLSGGKPCEIFSMAGKDQFQVGGTLHWVTGNRAHIILRTNDHPDWLDRGRIGVQMVFDESGFSSMSDAVKKLAAAEYDRTSEIRDMLFGNRMPGFTPAKHIEEIRGLNASQSAAVDLALRAKDVAIIHGPPGTGKTTTLVEVITRCAKRERPVLVCAPSNAAVDLLTDRCSVAGLDVLRIGNLSRIDKNVLEHTLAERVKNHGMARDLADLRKQANEYRRLASQYKRSFGRDEREQRKRLLVEAKRIIADVRRIEELTTKMIIDQADVVACTLVAARSHEFGWRRFDTVVIDEAGQALDPAMCIPLLRANRVILAGDPHQLPPTVLDQKASEMALGTTLLDRAIEAHPNAVCLLTEQYRMNHVIMSYSNQAFYSGKVTSHPSVEDRTIPAGAPLQESLVLIDTSGRSWEEAPGEASESLANPGEASCALSVYDEISQMEGAHQWSVGIISPYRGQVRLLQSMLTEDQRHRVASLDVNTVDSFQGSECDVIIISLVRSNADQEIGFLKDIRRMNVALTRARRKLVIIGDGSTIASHPFYAGLWQYAEREATLKSAWEMNVDA